MKRGFTVVEVMVTLVVIGILLGLGTVGLRSTLANGRDSERQADIETLARGLEQRYDRGISYSFQADTDNNGSLETVSNTFRPGNYPGNGEAWDLFWYGGIPIDSIFPGASEAAFVSPSNNRLNSVCFWYWWSMPACDAAEKDSNIQGHFSDGSGGWKDTYLYEFVGPNGGYCNAEECVRYNLYWISETDKTVVKGIPGLKIWKSKRS